MPVCPPTTTRGRPARDHSLVAGSMSSSGLWKARLARMHDVMAGHVERAALPGLITVVSRRGEAHVECIGSRTIDGNQPMARDTICRIGSMTKPVTAVAAMILVEECVLRLDEPVDDLLPELAGIPVLRTLDAAVDDTVPANRVHHAARPAHLPDGHRWAVSCRWECCPSRRPWTSWN